MLSQIVYDEGCPTNGHKLKFNVGWVMGFCCPPSLIQESSVCYHAKYSYAYEHRVEWGSVGTEQNPNARILPIKTTLAMYY